MQKRKISQKVLALALAEAAEAPIAIAKSLATAYAVETCPKMTWVAH